MTTSSGYEKTPLSPGSSIQPTTVKINIGEAKSMGLIGAILNLVGLIAGGLTGIGLILTIIGVILIYIGVSRLSERVGDPRPKSYYFKFLLFILIAIIASLAGIVVALGSIFAGIGAGVFGGPAAAAGGLFAAIGTIIVALIVAWILSIIAALNLRKSYDLVKQHTKVDTFGTAGFLYFLGAILLIILIGGIILFIAVILELVAWASTPETIETTPARGVETSIV